MNDNNERICDGCHDAKESDVYLRTIKMEYGEKETLCPDCIRQSYGLMG